MSGRRVVPRLIGPFHVGPRKVSRDGHGAPIVYLGKEFDWAVGKKVTLQLVVMED